jgi:hypothetical protein
VGSRPVVPGAKLIYLVRNPVDRAISHYLHTQARGNERRPIDDALGDFREPYVARGLFYRNLRPFLKRFPRESLLVVPQGALRDDRLATLGVVFRFVGAEPVNAPAFTQLHRQASSEPPELDAGLRARLENHFRADFMQTERLLPPAMRKYWHLG